MIECENDYSREFPSERYENLLKEYEEMHDYSDKMFNGRSLLKFRDAIKHILRENNCENVLDYGSGKGQLYTKEYTKITDKISKPLPEYWNLKDYKLYDPGYEEHAKLPTGSFDGVISTDVLEHVPEEDLGWVVDEMLDYTKKILFINVSCMPALKTFKDGTNVHVSIFSPVDWAKFLASRMEYTRSHVTIFLYADYSEEDGELKNKIYRIKYKPTIFEMMEG